MRAVAFWTTSALLRAWKFGEAELPATFEVLVNKKIDEWLCGVRIKEWNLQVVMLAPASREVHGDHKALPEPQVGEWWEAEIDEVNVYRRFVQLKPIRRISTWDWPSE
jgi:hypothetical protein